MDQSSTVLVRYGAIPEVARFSNPRGLSIARGDDVIVSTHRGLERGTVLELLRPPVEAHNGTMPIEPAGEILRLASPEDLERQQQLRRDVEREFPEWTRRIAEWRLDLQLIDLEWTLDRTKLILYVLNERGPECTKLALQAAASGLGIVEVQPVSSEGPVPQGGHRECGSCGCHA